MTEEQRDYKLKQFKELLNQALNEAMCYNKRIKNPNSNNVAEFVNDFIYKNNLAILCEGVSDWEKTFDEKFENRFQFSGDAPKVKDGTFYCSQTGWNGTTCISQCQMCKP